MRIEVESVSIAFPTAKTRLLSDEIMDATNLIRAARMARWTVGLIRPLEHDLIDALVAFVARYRRIEEA